MLRDLFFCRVSHCKVVMKSMLAMWSVLVSCWASDAYPMYKDPGSKAAVRVMLQDHRLVAGQTGHCSTVNETVLVS